MLGSMGYDRVVDLSGEEAGGRYFEGTGVLVVDRINGVAYVALSERADASLAEVCGKEREGGGGESVCVCLCVCSSVCSACAVGAGERPGWGQGRGRAGWGGALGGAGSQSHRTFGSRVAAHHRSAWNTLCGAVRQRQAVKHCRTALRAAPLPPVPPSLPAAALGVGAGLSRPGDLQVHRLAGGHGVPHQRDDGGGHRRGGGVPGERGGREGAAAAQGDVSGAGRGGSRRLLGGGEAFVGDKSLWVERHLWVGRVGGWSRGCRCKCGGGCWAGAAQQVAAATAAVAAASTARVQHALARVLHSLSLVLAS